MSPKSYGEVLPPVPVNMTLSAYVQVKMRSCWSRAGSYSIVTSVRTRRGKEVQRQTQREDGHVETETKRSHHQPGEAWGFMEL